MARGEDGWCNTTSVKMTPVSAARLEAVSSFASCPVATRRREIEGIPYVYVAFSLLLYSKGQPDEGANDIP